MDADKLRHGKTHNTLPFFTLFSDSCSDLILFAGDRWPSHENYKTLYLPVRGAVLGHGHGEAVGPLKLRLLPQSGQLLNGFVSSAQRDAGLTLIERETKIKKEA